MINDSNNVWYVTVIIGSLFVNFFSFLIRRLMFLLPSQWSQEWKSDFSFNQHILFTEHKSMQLDCFITLWEQKIFPPQINGKNWHNQNMDSLETQPKQLIDKVWLMFWSLINSPSICSHTDYSPNFASCPSSIIKQLTAKIEPVSC